MSPLCLAPIGRREEARRVVRPTGVSGEVRKNSSDWELGVDFLKRRGGNERQPYDPHQRREGSPCQRPARESRNAAISSPLRTSRTSPTSTGWFQVFPSIALKRVTSEN